MRTIAALAILLAFWGAVGYTFWPEIAPGMLRVVQAARGIGAQEIESRYLHVRNRSSASEAQVRAAVQALEADYESIRAYLGDPSDYAIPVWIVDGSGPALTDGTCLNVFYDGQAIALDAAPLFMALLWEGDLSLPDMNLFAHVGSALYVVEEIGSAGPLIGQPTDAWVALFQRQGSLIPLSEAWAVTLPDSEKELARLLRAALEGGSFMRWVAEKDGWEAVQDLRNGLHVTQVTGLSLAEAEQAWLASVMARALQPQPCAQAIPASSSLHSFCRYLE
jgi:hypothetical protein